MWSDYILDPTNKESRKNNLNLSCWQPGRFTDCPPPQIKSLPHEPSNPPRDITPKEEPSPKAPLPFEKLSFGEKLKTIETLIETSGYKYYKKDTATQPIENWTDEELLNYYKHILKESNQ
jgi:hypothetical protein